MIPPPMEPEQTSSQAQTIVTYILSDEAQRSEMYSTDSDANVAINRYHLHYTLDERRVITAMFRLGMHNRNVYTWLADNHGATKQYWHKVAKRMKAKQAKKEEETWTHATK